MTIPNKLTLAITLLIVLQSQAQGEESQTDPFMPFAVANVHFEQNATDGDVEVVFRVKSGKEGLAKLNVVSPDGRNVIDFTAPDSSTLGIRQFEYESPEPKEIKSLKSAYPEGIYIFTGTSITGVEFKSESKLSHQLPDTVFFVKPEKGAHDIGIMDLKITWTPINNVAAYIIEIEQDDLDVKIKAQLPGSVTTFAVPDGFLRPDTEYQLGIGTVLDDGNSSYVETTFTTGRE